MRTIFVLFALVVAAAAVAVPPAQLGSVAECLMCEVAVKEADPALDKDTKTIEKDFIKECEKVIPGKLGNLECNKYAQKELGGIEKELESGTAPADICNNLHACGKK